MAYRSTRSRAAPRSRYSRGGGNYGKRGRSPRRTTRSSGRRASSGGRSLANTLKIVVETVGSQHTAARQPLQVEAPAPKKASFPKA